MSLSKRALGCLIFVVLLGWQIPLALFSTYDFAPEKARAAACAGWLKQNVIKYSEFTDENQRRLMVDEINKHPCRGFGASKESAYLSIEGDAEGRNWPLVIDRPGNHLSYSSFYFAGIIYMDDWSGINAGYRDGHIEFFSKTEAIPLISTLQSEGAIFVDANGRELNSDELVVVNRRLSFHPYKGTWHPSVLMALLIIYGILTKWFRKTENDNTTEEGQQDGSAKASQ